MARQIVDHWKLPFSSAARSCGLCAAHLHPTQSPYRTTSNSSATPMERTFDFCSSNENVQTIFSKVRRCIATLLCPRKSTSIRQPLGYRIENVGPNLKYSTCEYFSILPSFSFVGMCAKCGGSHPRALQHAKLSEKKLKLSGEKYEIIRGQNWNYPGKSKLSENTKMWCLVRDIFGIFG